MRLDSFGGRFRRARYIRQDLSELHSHQGQSRTVSNGIRWIVAGPVRTYEVRFGVFREAWRSGPPLGHQDLQIFGFGRGGSPRATHDPAFGAGREIGDPDMDR